MYQEISLLLKDVIFFCKVYTWYIWICNEVLYAGTSKEMGKQSGNQTAKRNTKKCRSCNKNLNYEAKSLKMSTHEGVHKSETVVTKKRHDMQRKYTDAVIESEE